MLLGSMSRENRPLLTNAPVEFGKFEFKTLEESIKTIYKNLKLMKKDHKMSTL